MGVLARIGNYRRHISWTAFLLLLVGFGWTLHAKLPPAPRWVVRGQIAAVGLTPDGKTYRTETCPADSMPSSLRSPQFPFEMPKTGPVQFWDVETGREVQSVLGESGPRWRVTFSGDGSRLVAIESAPPDARQEDLRSIDLLSGRESRSRTDHRTDRWVPTPSANGELLLLEEGSVDRQDTNLFVYDAESLRLLKKMLVKNRWPRWQWAKDGKAVYVYLAEEGETGSLHRIDRAGERVVHCDGAGDWLAISPDGKLLATAPPRTVDDDIAPIDCILLWDVDTGKQLSTIPVTNFHPRSAFDNLLFLPDNQTLMVTHGTPRPGDMVGAWDIETGKCLGEVQVEPYRTLYFPEQHAFAARGPKGQGRLEWYRARPFGKLWERDWPGKELHWATYLPGPKRLLALSGADAESHDLLELLDIETGETRLTLPLNPKDQHHWLAQGTRLALCEKHFGDTEKRSPWWEFVEERILGAFFPTARRRDSTPATTRVFDTETSAELCRIELAGGDLHDFAADGRSLIYYQEAGQSGEATVSCYDVPPQRYWAWIFGVPLFIGVQLAGLRFGWRKLRRRPTGSGKPIAASVEA